MTTYTPKQAQAQHDKGCADSFSYVIAFWNLT